MGRDNGTIITGVMMRVAMVPKDAAENQNDWGTKYTGYEKTRLVYELVLPYKRNTRPHRSHHSWRLVDWQ